MKPVLDLSTVQPMLQSQLDAAYAAGVTDTDGSAPAPVGVSSAQEAADIAAAVKPLQDQITSLRADDDAKTALNAQLTDTVAKIKAILS